MILRLTFANNLPVPVVLDSSVASEQPLVPHQSLQLTVELHEGRDGVVELQLGVKPGQ
jgi:hypothetical protein